MYWRCMPYFDPEELARLHKAPPAAEARDKTNVLGCRTRARRLVSDFWGAIRALCVRP